MLAALDELEADVASGAFGPADGRRGRAHRAGARPDRARRPGPRRQAARRAVPQRPGRHAVPDVAARRGPARRPGVVDVVDALARPGRRRTRTRRCPAARTCSTPSPCCSPTTSPRTRTRCCATSTGCATGTGGRPCRPYGSGALAGSSLGLDPEAVAAELGFDCVGGELDRRHRVARLRRRGGVRAGDDRASTCRGSPRRSSSGPPRSSPTSRWTTPSRPAARSCRRRRTRTSRSWRAARPAG